jgi:putative hydrolase of the HAD superfamily
VSICLISFDCWSTLASSNKVYQRRRVELVAQALTRTDLAAVQAAMDSADDELDALAVTTGQHHGFQERILQTASRLDAAAPTDERLDALRDKMEAAFLRDPPTRTEQTLPETLAELRQQGFQIAIVSNTGFVPGRLMRLMLARLGLLNLVDYSIFSDEIGYTKPSRRIYEHLTAVSGCRPSETVHAGDNRDTDYEGALAAGLHALWYRPGSAPGADVLLSHRDLIGHPLLGPPATADGPPDR